MFGEKIKLILLLTFLVNQALCSNSISVEIDEVQTEMVEEPEPFVLELPFRWEFRSRNWGLPNVGFLVRRNSFVSRWPCWLMKMDRTFQFSKRMIFFNTPSYIRTHACPMQEHLNLTTTDENGSTNSFPGRTTLDRRWINNKPLIMAHYLCCD